MFTPTAYDIKWVEGLIDRLNDGGQWINSHGIYRVDKGKKALSLIYKFKWANSVTQVTIHDRTEIVLREIGWGMEEVVDDEET